MTTRPLLVLALATTGIAFSPSPAQTARPPGQTLEVSRLFIEYNESAQDLGFQVALDGEDWTSLRITNPDGKTIFAVKGSGPYGELGLTELLFEGAEPSLSDVPVDELLAKFPEGTYTFSGKTVDKGTIEGEATLTHAVPAGPVISTEVDGDHVVISWDPVTQSAAGLPVRPITITGYQILAGDLLQINVPANVTSVTLPPEFVGGLPAGEQEFEVLAIEQSGNQTITEGTFTVGP